MSAIPLPYVQNSPDWIDARRDHIGSSDIPILTGNSPYRSSPFDLWCYKTRRLEAAPVDPMTQELWDLGHAMEPVIAERYTALTSRRLWRVNRLLQHRSIEWATASLDRRAIGSNVGPRIVEIKWVPWRRYVEGPEPVPAYVQDQVQWQLMVTGFPVADVAVLNGSHIEVHEVLPDEGYQAALLSIAREFWDRNLQGGEAPAMDGSEATRRALLRLYPRDDGEFMDPTPELVALMGEWREARPAAKAATEREDRIKNAIRGVLAEHAGAETDAWRVTNKLTKGRTTTDWRLVAQAYRKHIEFAGVDEALEAELEAIESLHTTTGEGARTLTPRWKEGTETWT
jgi:putative phage-type endonuclease